MPPQSLAIDGRFDEEGDWIVRQLISPSDPQREPEEYVARHAHCPGVFSSRHRTAISPGPR